MNEDYWRFEDIFTTKGKYYSNGMDYGDMKDIIMDYLSKQAASEYYYKETKPEPTIEDRVVDIVKGGFEDKFGMTIQEFQEVYEKLVEESPERLI
jgi:hypothetical protein